MKFIPIGPEKCLRFYEATNTNYEDIDCVYPFLSNFYTSYEKKFNVYFASMWMENNPHVPVIAVTLYAIAILYGRHHFKTNPAWNMRQTLAMWNLFLSVFSFIGFTRMFPSLVRDSLNYSPKEFYCSPGEARYGSHGAGLWGFLFILSKFPELLDTFFIVIHKKPLIFLHWYHHITVLLYSWYAYVSRSPVSIVFCTMNYAVHAIMYFYYFLMAVDMKPKAFKAIYITLAQISQMVLGVSVTLISAYFLYFDKDVIASIGTENQCALDRNHIWGGFVMYGSYLALFVQFFVTRFVHGKTSSIYISKDPNKVKRTANGKIAKED